MPTLYEIKGDYALLLEILSQSDEITEEQMASMLEIQDELNVKLDAYGIVIDTLEQQSAHLKTEENRLAAWRKTTENRIAWMRQNVVVALTESNIDKLQTDHWRYSFRKSTAVEVNDGFVEWAKKAGRDDLLVQPEPKPDLRLIKNALNIGNEFGFARLVERRSLQIR